MEHKHEKSQLLIKEKTSTNALQKLQILKGRMAMGISIQDKEIKKKADLLINKAWSWLCLSQ